MKNVTRPLFVVLVLLAAFFQTSCVSTNDVARSNAASVGENRSPASVEDHQVLEAELQSILHSADPAAVARLHVDRVVRLYYRTQALLQDYDQFLNQLVLNPKASGTQLLMDPTYVKMIAAWTLREEAFDRLRFFYRRLLEIQYDRGPETKESRDLHSRALVMNSAMKKALVANAQASDKLAKQDLLRELIHVNREYREELKAARLAKAKPVQTPESALESEAEEAIQASASVQERDLQVEVIESPAGLQNYLTTNSKSLGRRSNSAVQDRELNVEIDKLTPDITLRMSDQFMRRDPQANGTYFPDGGPSGMMNGTKFKTGRWVLTFDDGPHSTYTDQIVANLKASGVKNTFFWLAQNVKAQPGVVRRAKAGGSTLANHSYGHPQLTKLGAAGLAREIRASSDVEEAVYGSKPKFFRCPYGACGPQNSPIRQMIASEGMISVMWNVDSLDWQDKNATSVYERVKKQMAVQKRGIILFHDIHPQSVAASKRLMADFKAGQATGAYRTLTIEQAYDESNSPGGMK